MMNKTKISSGEQNLIIYVLLAAVTLAVFWQVNHYGFVFDDVVYVNENYHLQTGLTLEGIRWAFSTTYAEFWHPLTWLSLLLDYQLFGSNAGGFHMTNLILHILSTLLLFWLFNRMTQAVWRSAFVAALFALHPLHVESAAWIAERKDVLSGFFWMLTLCLYVYYTEKLAIRRYLLVLFSFALALMSKPMVVTLPIMMVLLDYWPLKRFESRKGNLFLWQLKEKATFFILSAVFSVITIYARYTPYGKDFHIPLDLRISNATIACVTYLEKTLWPYDLAVFYPFPAQIPDGKVIGALCLILILSVLVMMMVKRLPFLFVGWLWYAITIAPVLGVIKVGDFSMADRFHYIPSIGIAIMIAWGIPSLMKSEKIIKKILFPTGIIFLAFMALITWRQCGYWKNNKELFSHALKVTKNNYIAHNNIGLALSAEGKIKEAMEHYNESIRIKPSYVYAYNNRGILYGKSGQYQLAMNDFNEAVRRFPFYADAYNNKGFTYDKIGQYQLAIEYYNKSLTYKSDYSDAYSNRAAVLLKHGNMKLGCLDAQKACSLGNCATLKSAQSIDLCR